MTVRELEDVELWIAAAHRLLREAVCELSAPAFADDGLPDRYKPLRSDIEDVEARLRKLHDELLHQTRASRRICSLTNKAR